MSKMQNDFPNADPMAVYRAYRAVGGCWYVQRDGHSGAQALFYEPRAKELAERLVEQLNAELDALTPQPAALP